MTGDVLTVALQSGANDYWTDLTNGAGAGLIDAQAALDRVAWNQISDCDLERHDVALLPYIRDDGVMWTATVDAIDCAYASSAPIHVLTPDEGFVAALDAMGEVGDEALLG